MYEFGNSVLKWYSVFCLYTALMYMNGYTTVCVLKCIAVPQGPARLSVT